MTGVKTGALTRSSECPQPRTCGKRSLQVSRPFFSAARAYQAMPGAMFPSPPQRRVARQYRVEAGRENCRNEAAGRSGCGQHRRFRRARLGKTMRPLDRLCGAGSGLLARRVWLASKLRRGCCVGLGTECFNLRGNTGRRIVRFASPGRHGAGTRPIAACPALRNRPLVPTNRRVSIWSRVGHHAHRALLWQGRRGRQIASI